MHPFCIWRTPFDITFIALFDHGYNLVRSSAKNHVLQMWSNLAGQGVPRHDLYCIRREISQKERWAASKDPN